MSSNVNKRAVRRICRVGALADRDRRQHVCAWGRFLGYDGDEGQCVYLCKSLRLVLGIVCVQLKLPVNEQPCAAE